MIEGGVVGNWERSGGGEGDLGKRGRGRDSLGMSCSVFPRRGKVEGK